MNSEGSLILCFFFVGVGLYDERNTSLYVTTKLLLMQVHKLAFFYGLLRSCLLLFDQLLNRVLEIVAIFIGL